MEIMIILKIIMISNIFVQKSYLFSFFYKQKIMIRVIGLLTISFPLAQIGIVGNQCQVVFYPDLLNEFDNVSKDTFDLRLIGYILHSSMHFYSWKKDYVDPMLCVKII